MKDLFLPDGYRVREVEGRQYLIDPSGIPLHGPTDPFLIEAYAWRHAWRQIERELNMELVELHAGRPHSARRLGQYMRMLNAAGQIRREVAPRPAWNVTVVRAAFAVSAAAAAVVLLIAPLRTARTPQPAASSRPATIILGRPPVAALPAEPSSPGNVRVAHATPPVRHRPASSKYRVTFGEFVNRAAAEAMMHLIRSKGYIVHVARVGEDFWVLTRPYPVRARVERLVRALQEIGLPAQLATALQAEALSD